MRGLFVMKKSLWMSLVVVAALMFTVVPAIVEAHVTVSPDESTTNAYEKYAVRVPVEKEINTTKVKLQVPEGITIASVMPMPAWDYKVEKDNDGLIKSVTWTAIDEGIKPGEFMEFSFIGANPSEAGEISWKALQTYEDGSVVEWVGPPDAEKPASVTKIAEANEAAPHGDNANESTQGEDEHESTSDSNNWIPIGISIVALLIAVIGLFRKKA